MKHNQQLKVKFGTPLKFFKEIKTKWPSQNE